MPQVFVFLLSLAWLVTASAAVYTLAAEKKSLMSDGKLHVFLCGTGNPEPNMQALRHPACVAVIGDNQFFMIDAGGAAIQTIASLGLPIADLYHVFITHWHSDHFAGLGQVINESWIRGRTQPIDIYGPRGIKKILSGLKKEYALDVKYRVANRDGLLNKSLAFGVPKEVKAIRDGVQIYQEGNITINAFKVVLNPAAPALGYRIHYKACKLVISGDTKVASSLAKNAKGADVLINEVFSHYFYELAKEKAKKSNRPRSSLKFLDETWHYHSDSWQLAKMAQQYHVKHLFLTHLMPSVGTTAVMKKTFIDGMNRFYKGPITVTNDRDEIVLESKNGQCKVSFIPAKQANVSLYKIPN